MQHHGALKIRASALVLLAALLVLPLPARVNAADDGTAQELADRYAPIIMVKAQDGPCDGNGEPYAPAAVDIILDNPEIVLRQVGTGNPVVKVGPAAADLFGLGEGFFIDFPGSSLTPGCIYERAFDKYTRDRTAVVYAHIVQQADVPDQLALQYWFYWYYNDWNNKHESDWEGIQLLFDASSVDEALTKEPTSIGYAQHEGGERAQWDSAKRERDGTHPVVYSSRGSHASYYSSAVYLGRGASEGFGCDTTDGPSDRIEPEVVVLPDRVDDPQDPLAWLAYEGRWGERQSGAFNGPTGPTAKERWLNPVDWHDELRSASVVIPAGDSRAAEVVSLFCSAVESGSGALILFSTSPLRAVVVLGLATLAGLWLLRRTDWSRVKPLPMIRRRRAGQILRASARLFRRTPTVWTFGLFYLPAAILVGALAGVVGALPLIREALDLAGSASVPRLLFVALVGGFVNIAAFVAVNATIAAHFRSTSEADQPPAAADTLHQVWRRRRDLAIGFVRSYLIVVGLSITIIGIPFAIRQLVRYQFMPHTVMMEDLDGRGALSRSTMLVRGRWWHTALVTGAINAMVGLTGLVLGLLLLIAISGLPLWVFSGLVTAIYAVVAPLAAIAQTMLYGDAAAAELDVDLDEAGLEPVLA